MSWELEVESLYICFGDVFFVGAGTSIELEASGVGELVIYRAFVEIDEGAVAHCLEDGRASKEKKFCN